LAFFWHIIHTRKSTRIRENDDGGYYHTSGGTPSFLLPDHLTLPPFLKEDVTSTCHYRLEDTERAIEIWKRSLGIDPDLKNIKKTLVSLKKKE
jgi:hypothetical protein